MTRIWILWWALLFGSTLATGAVARRRRSRECLGGAAAAAGWLLWMFALAAGVVACLLGVIALTTSELPETLSGGALLAVAGAGAALALALGLVSRALLLRPKCEAAASDAPS